jgi:hypothetical protein
VAVLAVACWRMGGYRLLLVFSFFLLLLVLLSLPVSKSRSEKKTVIDVVTVDQGENSNPLSPKPFFSTFWLLRSGWSMGWCLTAVDEDDLGPGEDKKKRTQTMAEPAAGRVQSLYSGAR